MCITKLVELDKGAPLCTFKGYYEIYIEYHSVNNVKGIIAWNYKFHVFST
jgi:hypothetical protein